MNPKHNHYTIAGDQVRACGLEGPALPHWDELDDYCESALTLDVSAGMLVNLSNVSYFKNLQSLVADDNRISSLETFPDIPTLRTLSLNKNDIASLASFLVDAAEKFPQLAFLSLLGNPCCPSETFGSLQEEYQSYVDDVAQALPSLEFLDSAQVPRRPLKHDLFEQNVTHTINAQMMFSKFQSMMAQHRGSDSSMIENPETGTLRRRSLTYLKVKAVLQEEFGKIAFDLKKEEIRRQMQLLEREARNGSSGHADSQLADGDANTVQPPLLPEVPIVAVDELGAKGTVLQVEIRRPTRFALGFRIVGGCDRAFGAVFVSAINSSSANELQVGDRLLVVNHVGLLTSSYSEAERIMNKLPQQIMLTVLRIGEDEWVDLQDEVRDKQDPIYNNYYRRLECLPLIRQTSLVYVGLKELMGTSVSQMSSGEIVGITVHKSEREPLGVKMAGSFELGGIFITEIAPGSPADEEPNLKAGNRILQVAGRSVLFSTQEEAAMLIRSCKARVELVCQAVETEQWHEIVRVSSSDQPMNCVSKALLARKAGKVDEAVEHYQEALSCEMIEPTLKCQVLNGLGSIHVGLKKYNQAVKFHLEEVQMCRLLDNAFMLARSLDSLGLAYRMNESMPEAIETYEKEIEVAKEAKDYSGIGRAWSNLGITHGMLKNYQRAVECHSKALMSANDTQDRMAAARAHSNLGISFSMLKEFDQSIKHHTSRLRIAQELKDHTGEFRALGNLCAAAKAQGNTKLAREYWEQQQHVRVQTNQPIRVRPPHNEQQQPSPSTSPPRPQQLQQQQPSPSRLEPQLPQQPLLSQEQPPPPPPPHPSSSQPSENTGTTSNENNEIAATTAN